MECAFDLADVIELLDRTPGILRASPAGLSDEWVHTTEGPKIWSPFDIVGHLIHGEKTDWIPRAKHILSGESTIPFEPFDRFAQFEDSAGKSLDSLLDEFETLRRKNLEELASFELAEADLALRGHHPEFGTVTLRQLLATWVAHDLSHLAQMARVMGRRYKEDAGPWKQYLSVLKD